MQNLRTLIVGVVGVAIAALTVVVLATVGLAIVGFAVVAGSIGLLVAKFGRTSKVRKNPDSRVWNDGHGTIIDL